MHEFIIFTIGGLAAAGIYAITASGLTLTYTTTGIFNWAHGAIGMICAFFYWQLTIGWGWPVLPSMFVCLFVLAPIIGIVIEASVMRRLEGVSEASKLVVTLSIALMLLGLAQWIWNPTTYRALPPLFNNKTLVLGSIRISYDDVTILILAIVVAVGLRIFLYRTRIGVTMRASVDDRTLTSLNGSSAITNTRNAWIIGSMLAALAGILIAPTLTLSAPALTLLIVNAYAASVIGRLKSIPMTFVGAIILGLSIVYAVAYLPQNPYVQGFDSAVPAIILFLALLLLPQARLRGHRQLRSRELAYRPSWSGTGVFCVVTIIVAIFFATTVGKADMFALNKMWGLAIVGLSVIPIIGYAGRLSLCQMTFAGIGATMVGHLSPGGNPLSLLAAAGVCAVVGVIIAIPALRLEGIYFALATAAFSVTMDNWVFQLPAFDLFGHPYVPFGSGTLVFAPYHIGSLALKSEKSQFIAGSVAFGVLVLLVVALRRSGFGQRLLAMKDSPAACATLGMNGRASLVGVFAFSAALAGVGGGIYGMEVGSANPTLFQLFYGLSIILVMVIMGLTSLGAAGLTGLYEGSPFFTNFFPSLTQLPLVLVGLGGVGVGTTPNGTVPGSVRPVYLSVTRRRWLLALIVGVVALAWALRLGGAIGNWPMTIIILVALGVFPVPAYVVDYRARIAPPAFGLRSDGRRRSGTPSSPRRCPTRNPSSQPTRSPRCRGQEAPVGLEIEAVSVRFGGLAALPEVTVSAAEGAITGLIGPNGAGKTTLFNVVTGMQRPNAGSVRLDGRDLRGLSSYRRARLGLGRTFQRLELFGSLTVAENIGVAASIAQRGVAKARSRTIHETREEILDRVGLRPVANERADTLPTGTGRLVELARALATRPKVLLLDEPAAGQDVDETERFSGILHDLANDGLAILLVEHDMELVMHVCDTIAVLDYGRIICTGTPAEVRADHEVQAAYLGTVAETVADA